MRRYSPNPRDQLLDPGLIEGMSKQRAHRVRDDEALAALVIPPRGPRTQRQSGAGKHDSRPQRERAKGQSRRAAIARSADGR